jgi:hypothetical protein
MRNLNKSISFLFLLGILFLGCKKNAVEDITTPYSGAQFKVYNFTYVRSATPAPSTTTVTFNAYANDVRFATVVSTTGTESPNALTMGNLSPARGYALAPAGQVVLTAKSPSTAVVSTVYGFGPDLEIAKVSANVVAGRNYSFYVNGYFDPVTKKADGFIVEDKLPEPDTAAAYIRLVNPAPNTSTLSLQITRTYKVDGVDVIDTTTPINGVAYKSASEFVRVPSGVYNTLKCTDLATGKSVTRTTATTLLKNRVYTFTVRGDLVGTTSYPALFLDFTENR